MLYFSTHTHTHTYTQTKCDREVIFSMHDNQYLLKAGKINNCFHSISSMSLTNQLVRPHFLPMSLCPINRPFMQVICIFRSHKFHETFLPRDCSVHSVCGTMRDRQRDGGKKSIPSRGECNEGKWTDGLRKMMLQRAICGPDNNNCSAFPGILHRV